MTSAIGQIELLRRLEIAEAKLASADERAKLLLEAKNQWRDRAIAAEANAAHWKTNHDNQVARAKVLIDRTDMPLERVKAYRTVERASAMRRDAQTVIGFIFAKFGAPWNAAELPDGVVAAVRGIEAALKEPGI